MLSTVLSLGLCMQAGVAPSSRYLPADRTLVAAEVAPPQVLWEHRNKIAQLGIFARPAVFGMIQKVTASSRSKLPEVLPKLHDLIHVYDRGWTVGAVFVDRPSRDRRDLQGFYLGYASDAKRARSTDALLKAVFAPAGDKIKRWTGPVVDSPVVAVGYAQQPDNPGNNYFWSRGALHAVKGRSAAFWVGREYYYGNELEEQMKKGREIRVASIGSLIGLGKRSRGGMQFGDKVDLGEGATKLGSFVFRFKQNIQDKVHGARERQREMVKQSGFWEWDGVKSLTYLDGKGVPHVHAQIRHGADEWSFFKCFKPNGRSLGDSAAALPQWALGAARLSIDVDHTMKLLRDGWPGAFRYRADELDEVLTWVRAMAGLAPAEGRPSLAGLRELTIGVLPAAPGSLLPELVMCVRSPAREGEVDGILERVSQLVTMMTRGNQKVETKTLGKGEDAIKYLSLKSLFQGAGRGGMRPGNIEMMLASSMLGGGFVSAKRQGDWLYVGFNPRTVRKLVRSVKKGETLDKRSGFAARFPKGAARPLEMWFDFKGIAKSMKALDNVMPMMLLGMPVAPGQRGADQPVKNAALPTTADLVAVLGEESLWAEKAEYGWKIESVGGTMLSPSLWTTVTFAGIGWDILDGVVR